MKIEVYDDFLESDAFDFVQRHMLGDMFPWKYATVLNPEEDDLLCDQIDNVQFSQQKKVKIVILPLRICWPVR